jgi:hypothetical protein
MAKKLEEIWTPVLEVFMKEPALNSTLPKKRGKLPHAEFTEDELQQCFNKWAQKYKQVKDQLGIANHPRIQHETGAETPGEVPADLLAKTAEHFPMWSQFHAEFGLCARYRDDLHDESMSPMTKTAPASNAGKAVLPPSKRAGSQRVAAVLGVSKTVRKAANGGVTPPAAMPEATNTKGVNNSVVCSFCGVWHVGMCHS